jgi:hypothetical protein
MPSKQKAARSGLYFLTIRVRLLLEEIFESLQTFVDTRPDASQNVLHSRPAA